MSVAYRIEKKLAVKTRDFFPYTNVIGLARSIISFGTLLTLLINPLNNLFHKTVDDNINNPLLSSPTSLIHFNYFTVFGFENVGIMKWMAVLILLVTISGYFIKITSILHWWISISFLYFSSIVDGGDQIAAILTFLLLPVCLTDNRKNHWLKITSYSSARTLFAIFSLWIIRIQVAIIYFHAAVGKFFVPEWTKGTALYYWRNHSVFGMPTGFSSFINSYLSDHFIITVLTYGVLIFEILLFLGLTGSLKYRKKILIVGLIFHFLIIVFHGIFSFFFSISAALILFLYPVYENINFKIWIPKRLRFYT